MLEGSVVSPTASLMRLFMQLHGGNCVDSFKAVVLGLPQWWEDVFRENKLQGFQHWYPFSLTVDTTILL